MLATNGSGVLTWQNVDQHFAAATSSDTTVTDTTSETTYGTGDFGTLPGQTLGSYGTLHAKVFVSNYQHTVAGTSNVILRLKLGGTTVCQVTFQDAETTAGDAIADMWMSNDGSSDSQFCQSTGSVSTDTTTGHQFHSEGYTTSSVDTSSDQAITLTIQWNNNDGGETETVTVSSLSVQAF